MTTEIDQLFTDIGPDLASRIPNSLRELDFAPDDNIEQWLSANHLTLNATKTKNCLFGTKQNLILEISISPWEGRSWNRLKNSNTWELFWINI